MILSCSIVVAGLFGANALATGEFNYQGGERKTFYGATTGFPFANTWETFDNRGVSMATDALPFDILLHRDTAPVLAWNLFYFTVGRYSGLLPYFFQGSSPSRCSSRTGRSAGTGKSGSQPVWWSAQ